MKSSAICSMCRAPLGPVADVVAMIIVLHLWPGSFDLCATIWEVVSDPSLAYKQGGIQTLYSTGGLLNFTDEKPTAFYRAQLHKSKWGSKRACHNFATWLGPLLIHFSIPKDSSAYLVIHSLKCEISAQRNQCSLPRKIHLMSITALYWWSEGCRLKSHSLRQAF